MRRRRRPAVPVTPAAARVLDRIQAAGGRLTTPTRHVVTILSVPDRHLTADDIIAELERVNPGVAPSTVYRVIQRLDDLGLLEHVHHGGGAAFYHLREQGHAHLACSSCGEVADLAALAEAALAAFARVLCEAHGFHLDPHHAALLGTCARCARPSHDGPTVIDRPVGDELASVNDQLHHHGGTDVAN